MAMLRIEPDLSTKEARRWLEETFIRTLKVLDFEGCVGVVSEEHLLEELTYAVMRLEASEVDRVALHSINALLED